MCFLVWVARKKLPSRQELGDVSMFREYVWNRPVTTRLDAHDIFSRPHSKPTHFSPKHSPGVANMPVFHASLFVNAPASNGYYVIHTVIPLLPFTRDVGILLIEDDLLVRWVLGIRRKVGKILFDWGTGNLASYWASLIDFRSKHKKLH